MKKILYLILVFISISFIGCKTQSKIEYRDRDVLRYINTIQVDTFLKDVKDSIYINTYTKNDTTYINKYKERLVYKDRIKIKTDTIVNDSIVNIYKENIIVKTKVPSWCYILLVINLLVLAIVVIKYYYKWKKI